MRDRLSEMIQSAVGGCAKYWADIIADKLIAEGVIVPPCKVGDTVYCVWQYSDFAKEDPPFIKEARVVAWVIDEGVPKVVTEDYGEMTDSWHQLLAVGFTKEEPRKHLKGAKMENLNAEAVKKALECCVKVGGYRDAQICNDCPLSETRCAILLPENALALINSQEQRIKELGEENERLSLAVEMDGFSIRNRLEGIERYCNEKIKIAQADTVRKVADLLWQGESEKLNISVGGKYYDKQEFIDQIAKEMLEGENER